MKLLYSLVVAMVAAGGLWSGSASAAASYCSALPSPTTNSDGLTTSDVDFRGVNADDCYGVTTNPNNDSLSAVNSLALWGGGWQTMARDVIGSGSDTTGALLGLNWVVQAFACSNSYTSAGCDWNDGSFRLTVSDPPPVSPTPVSVDMLIVLKASDRWAAYFFDAESFVLGSSGGTWDVMFKNNGKQYPDLSHISLYLRTDSTPTGRVPEPGSLALLGAGLLSLAALRVRRRAAH